MSIDYKIEADQNLTLALEHTAGYGHLSTADLIALAQVNATLYAAEQQRIANIIALAHIDQDEAAHVALWEMADDGFMAHYVLRDNIAEGLGI